MTTKYSEEFKDNMVQKMLAPGGLSATQLSDDLGISQPTLSRWLRESGEEGSASVPRRKGGKKTAKRPQDWSAEEKLALVIEASGLSGDELGVLLRRRGVHTTHVERWREATMAALGSEVRRPRGRSPESRRIRELERELARKDKALAETAALLVLRKKVEALWGDEDNSTARRSGK